MLNDARVSLFKKVYLAPGFTDLRRGIDGLTAIVRFQFSLDPYDKNTLFLFCGGGATGSKRCCGKVTVSCCCTNAWIMVPSDGRVRQKKHSN